MATRVLHIMSGFGGGISSFIWNKVTAVNKEKIVFDILTYDECSVEFVKDVNKMGGRVINMPNPKKKGWKAFYEAVDDVMKKKNYYEMIHCHISGYRAVPFRMLAKKNGLNRFAIHAHTSSDPLVSETKLEKVNRKINASIATEKISCGIKASNYIFGSKYVQGKKIMHIPNSIDDNLYFHNVDDTFKKAILGNKCFDDTIIIGHVGRFHQVKNHSFMIKIMLSLKEQGINFLWLFIGSGDLQSQVIKEVRRKGLQNNVQFMGRREDVHNFYQLMDVFVLPSFYEGFPTVAVEAQASGTPTILSDSISKEADLGMSLVEFCSINDNVDSWVENIIEAKSQKIPSTEQRKEIVKSKKFLNSSSAKLYEDFVLGKVKHYEI